MNYEQANGGALHFHARYKNPEYETTSRWAALTERPGERTWWWGLNNWQMGVLPRPPKKPNRAGTEHWEGWLQYFRAEKYFIFYLYNHYFARNKPTENKCKKEVACIYVCNLLFIQNAGLCIIILLLDFSLVWVPVHIIESCMRELVHHLYITDERSTGTLVDFINYLTIYFSLLTPRWL